MKRLGNCKQTPFEPAGLDWGMLMADTYTAERTAERKETIQTW